MKRLISFIPKDEKVSKFLKVPYPAKNVVPDWYKKSESFMVSDKLEVDQYATNAGLKHCTSFLDAIIHGYIFELWTDVYVSEGSDGIQLSWTNTPDPIVQRTAPLGANIPRPEGSHNEMFNWILQWGIKVPKGYSVLMTHPLNRTDLPFYTLSGIVDCDNYIGEGKVPFFIKKDFRGIIPAGTPIMQIIPIQTDDIWISEKSEDLMEERDRHQWLLRTSISGYYKKNFRKSKSFD
jgi:hypothetical protein